MENTTVVDKVFGSWNNTRQEVTRRVDELEKKAKDTAHTIEHRVKDTALELEHKVKGTALELERKAKDSMPAIAGVPDQLRGTWNRVLDSLRLGLDVATRQDLNAVSDRVEELARRVDKLAKERIAQVSAKVHAHKPGKR